MTIMITNKEKGLFLSLFNRGGYVLTFSTSSFDAFTMESVGVPLCETYGLSKGKSLESFLHDKDYSDIDKEKLLYDLLEYYESSYLFEDECGIYSPNSNYKTLYNLCKDIRDKNKGLVTAAILVDQVNNEINSDYINKTLGLIINTCSEFPAVAIGKSKELIESVCKTILDDYGFEYKEMTLNKLVKETMNHLNVSIEKIDESMKMSENIKGVINAMTSIVHNIGELRNEYGDGHGKSKDFAGLQPRHAKLVYGATSTVVYFLWETYKLKK